MKVFFSVAPACCSFRATIQSAQALDCGWDPRTIVKKKKAGKPWSEPTPRWLSKIEHARCAGPGRKRGFPRRAVPTLLGRPAQRRSAALRDLLARKGSATMVYSQRVPGRFGAGALREGVSRRPPSRFIRKYGRHAELVQGARAPTSFGHL